MALEAGSGIQMKAALPTSMSTRMSSCTSRLTSTCQTQQHKHSQLTVGQSVLHRRLHRQQRCARGRCWAAGCRLHAAGIKRHALLVSCAAQAPQHSPPQHRLAYPCDPSP